MILNEKQEKRILIVEDDAICAFIAVKILSSHFTTDVVTNGYEALAAVDKCKYDAVLMDINLGDMNMDGIRTMRLIRQNMNYKRIKIFAITAFSNARESYIEQGFDDMFLKPMDPAKMIRILNNKFDVPVVKKSMFINLRN